MLSELARGEALRNGMAAMGELSQIEHRAERACKSLESQYFDACAAHRWLAFGSPAATIVAKTSNSRPEPFLWLWMRIPLEGLIDERE